MQLYNRVKETTTTTGTGAITLAGAVAGFFNFGLSVTNEGSFDTCFLIEWTGGWEIACGQIVENNSVYSLTRDRVIMSSELGTWRNSGTGGQTDLPSGTKTVTLIAADWQLPAVDLGTDTSEIWPPQARGSNAIALGRSAYAKTANSLAVGRTAITEHVNAVAVGLNAASFGKNSFCVGHGGMDNLDTTDLSHATQIRGYDGNWSTLDTVRLTNSNWRIVAGDVTIVTVGQSGDYVGTLSWIAIGANLTVTKALTVVYSTFQTPPDFSVSMLSPDENDGPYGRTVRLTWGTPANTTSTMVRSEIFGCEP